MVSKPSGAYTNADYIRYVASDSGSGIADCYVKMPGSSVYTAYASGTQLATEGTYSFYCKDLSGNASTTVTITLDKTKPTGTLYGGADTVQSGDSTNAAYIRFVPYDAIGLSTTYVKKPGSERFGQKDNQGITLPHNLRSKSLQLYLIVCSCTCDLFLETPYLAII